MLSHWNKLSVNPPVALVVKVVVHTCARAAWIGQWRKNQGLCHELLEQKLWGPFFSKFGGVTFCICGLVGWFGLFICFWGINK